MAKPHHPQHNEPCKPYSLGSHGGEKEGEGASMFHVRRQLDVGTIDPIVPFEYQCSRHRTNLMQQIHLQASYRHPTGILTVAC